MAGVGVGIDPKNFILMIESYEFREAEQFLIENFKHLNSNVYSLALDYSILYENIKFTSILCSKLSFNDLVVKKFTKLCFEPTSPEMIYTMQQYIPPLIISQLVRTEGTYVVDLIEEDKLDKILRLVSSSEHSVQSLASQFKINNLAQESLRSSHLLVASRLIEGFYGVKPSQNTINQIFFDCIRLQKFNLAHILCDVKRGKSTVSVQGVDEAFIEAVNEYNMEGVLWLLGNKMIVPSLDVISAVYFDYKVYLYNHNMVELNKPMCSLLESNVDSLTIARVEKYIRCLTDRKARVATAFRTYRGADIHGYSASSVVHLRKNLNEAVLEVIKRKISGKRVLSESEILIFLTDMIRSHVNVSAQSRALDRIGDLLDSSSVELFGSVIVYLTSMFPSHVEVWIRGFIEESVSVNSCTAGALERIVTGLRGVGDPEIGQLFGQAEGPLLFTIFLRESMNIFGSELKYQTNHKRIIELINSELPREKSCAPSTECSEEELIRSILGKYVLANIESFGLDPSQYFDEAIPVLDIIMDCYDTHIADYIDRT